MPDRTTYYVAHQRCLLWCMEHKPAGLRGMMLFLNLSLPFCSLWSNLLNLFWRDFLTVGAIFRWISQRWEIKSWMQDVFLLSHTICAFLSFSFLFLNVFFHLSHDSYCISPFFVFYLLFTSLYFPHFFPLLFALTYCLSIPQTAVMASPGINIKALHNSAATSIMYDAMSHFRRMPPSDCVCLSVSVSLLVSVRWSQPARMKT